jgi:hypothetical protein
MERAEADYIVDWQIKGIDIGNTVGGCLGMCGENCQVMYAVE